MDHKILAVPVKVKATFEIRKLNHLSSQMRQSVIKRTIDNIRGLARLKENRRNIGLKERIYVCPICGNVMDRDLNSSIVIENEGLKQIGMVHTEFKPVETESSTLALEYLNRIPYVKASSVCEAGRLIA